MKVIVYSAPWCAPCKQVKKFLKDNKIEYTLIDIDEEPEKVRDIMSVPTIDIDGERIVGFNETKLRSMLVK